MSLRLRLSLLITLLFLLVLIAAGYVVIENARRAIEDEIHASANLTLQLIEIAFQNVEDQSTENKIALIDSIARLDSSRHLTITLIRHTNAQRTPFLPNNTESTDAPAWFYNIVKPPPIEFRRFYPSSDLPVELVIRSNAADEITEAWNDSKGVLLLLLLFVLFAIALVYFTLGKGLKPIDQILHGLEEIEQGKYQSRLPAFNLPELTKISEKFNHMAEVMEKSREENRALTEKSLAIQEQERQDLAHALHDELGQSITAVKAVAASINSDNKSSAEIDASVEAIIDVSNRMYDVARGMMRRLRPSILDELGIVPALQEMVDEWNIYHGDVFCHFDFSGNLDKLGETVNITLYRIIQESLTNVVKHARADTVNIQLNALQDAQGSGKISLSIKDNGLGFDSTQTTSGLGLLGMKERCEALHGNFELSSSPGNGVAINLSIPITNNTDEAP